MRSHKKAAKQYFYPRSPCGERLLGDRAVHQVNQHFYPRSPCGERLHAPSQHPCLSNISIHALLAESDVLCRGSCHQRRYFYPRSPCGERPVTARIIDPTYGFLSTLSLRRATGHFADRHRQLYHFYPRSPCGERLSLAYKYSIPYIYFYPRSPCGERPPPYNLMIHHKKFLSTLSLRRATCQRPKHQTQTQNFYPRSPCGERRVKL